MEAEMLLFEIVYKTSDCCEHALFRAVDEEDAIQKLRQYYPNARILEVECRGTKN